MPVQLVSSLQMQLAWRSLLQLQLPSVSSSLHHLASGSAHLCKPARVSYASSVMHAHANIEHTHMRRLITCWHIHVYTQGQQPPAPCTPVLQPCMHAARALRKNLRLLEMKNTTPQLLPPVAAAVQPATATQAGAAS